MCRPLRRFSIPYRIWRMSSRRLSYLSSLQELLADNPLSLVYFPGISWDRHRNEWYVLRVPFWKRGTDQINTLFLTRLFYPELYSLSRWQRLIFLHHRWRLFLRRCHQDTKSWHAWTSCAFYPCHLFGLCTRHAQWRTWSCFRCVNHFA